ncbi:hypothetical protein [Actinomadura sp. NPDC000929]|uniref:hypothetical protein n=1 Tax=Actinomadura sp. NPDC000929 TaxID=3154517 RepID=UPI0033976498
MLLLVHGAENADGPDSRATNAAMVAHAAAYPAAAKDADEFTARLMRLQPP